ncbi:hypothetical protein B4065_1465 [Caldibacillus thermoamylovorans]|uniref:hypothetical protein n=1 Tax=Caldibacillus thermoamylovorans TaxID=35841 RepID=UPI0005A43516|nr:hypothetical protein [Caldibacillus thermoamylovorans]KIO69292.1 hypothetical protein B4065_1465 [Caldibacillus thermoamylovorans]
MSGNKRKEYDDMSVEELLFEVSKIHKKKKPKKAKVESGEIILDPDNKYDKEWYENDKDYDVL